MNPDEEAGSETYRIRGYLFEMTEASFADYRRLELELDRPVTNPVHLYSNGRFTAKGTNPTLGQYLTHMVDSVQVKSPNLKVHICTRAGCMHEKDDFVQRIPSSNGT